jgi:hypothetical protein
MDKLTLLANKWGTDKGNFELWCHNYTPTYNEYFEELVDKSVRMLEIGVADPRFPGAGVKMWRDYFPNLFFVGYDINQEAKQFEEPNINIFIGDQNNPEDIQKCIDTYGGEFDIILDDGSHYSEHILTSFKHLFPHLNPGGYYIIEDLHSVYSNAQFTIPEVSNIITQNNFEIESVEQKHGGKMLVIKKAQRN